MTKTDIGFHVVEYILAALFIRGGALIFFLAVAPLEVPAILTYLVGEVAIKVYGLAFFATGVLLLIAKWFKQKALHKWILFTMWLTCVYVFALSSALTGFNWDQWLTVVCALASSAAWLRWKLKTEYIDPKEFNEELATLAKE